MTRPAVFFDRDNTLIEDVPYLGDPAQVRLLPFVRETLARLAEHGFSLFVVSNQSGVGRGMITMDQVTAVNEEMVRQLGAPFFTAIYNCYEDPNTTEAGCRKPSPAMVLLAAQEHSLDLQRSFFVGDRLADIQCGKNAGCRTILLRLRAHVEGLEQAMRSADYVASCLPDVAEWIIRKYELT